MNVFRYSYKYSDNYSFDSDIVEIASEQLRLLDLGGGTYSMANPMVECNLVLYHEDLLEFNYSATINGNDDIRLILSKGNYWYYWDGVAWVSSDGTYAQSSTIADIKTNITTFYDNTTETRTETKIRIFLHSDTGTTTPVLDWMEFIYLFGEFITIEVNQIITQNLDLVRLSNDDELQNDFIYDAVVNRTIDYAESEIKGYIQSQYDLPFSKIPNLIKLIAKDLVLYYLYQHKQEPPEPVVYKYDMRIKQLEQIQKGELGLDLLPTDIVWQDDMTISGVGIGQEDKVFSDEILDKL